MAISKGNNEEKILLDVSANVDDATSEIQKLEKELQKLQDVKINAKGDDLIKVNQQIKDVESAIAKANTSKLTPKTDNGNLKNTVLSLHEMEDLLNKIRDEQKVTKDPLKLQQLSKEAGELELKIRDINEPFRDINREIGELEDRLYAMAVAGERNTQEFQQTVLKVAELKKVVVEIDTAVDAISTDKFGKFIGVGEQMTGVFGGVTSALQLMGVDASRAEEQMAKLMQLQGLAQGLSSLNQFSKQWKGLMTSMKAGKVATETINTISDATEGASVATEGFSKSSKAGATSAKIFGTALKSIPVMALVGAITYLIANFEDVKRTIYKFLPSLELLEKGFNKVKNAITDWIGITSDATRALEELEKTTAIKNKGIDRQIELLEAQGGKEREIYQLRKKQVDDEIKLLNEKAKVNEKLSEEETDQLIDLHQKRNVIYLQEKKRQGDEAKEAKDKADEKAKERQQEYNEQLKQLKGYLKETEKITFASNNNQRQVELKNIKDKYTEQIELAKKLKQDYSKLESALQIESNAINKKYDEQYFAFIKNNSQQFLDSFSAEYLTTIESYNSQKVNATDEQKKDLDERLNNQLLYLSKIKQLSISMKNAENELSDAGINNTIDSDKDSFEKQKQKIDSQLQAQKEYHEAQLYNSIQSKQLENAENERLYLEGQERLKELMLDPSINAFAIDSLNADLNARLSAIQNNNTEIEDATRKHNQKLVKLDEDHAKAKEKVNKAKKASDEDLIKGTAEFLSTASDMFGEHTVANKAMNIASATMNAYVAGSKAFAELPYPTNFIGMATAIAGGLVNVKKIMDVKIPDAKNDTASQAINTSPISYSAPTINSTVLRNEENGSNNITNAIAESGNSQVIKAYITNSDLQTNEQKNNFIKNISSY